MKKKVITITVLIVFHLLMLGGYLMYKRSHTMAADCSCSKKVDCSSYKNMECCEKPQ